MLPESGYEARVIWILGCWGLTTLALELLLSHFKQLAQEVILLLRWWSRITAAPKARASHYGRTRPRTPSRGFERTEADSKGALGRGRACGWFKPSTAFTILVVEAEPGIRGLYGRAAQHAGCAVIETGDASTAFRIIGSGVRFDTAIIDVPTVSGDLMALLSNLAKDGVIVTSSSFAPEIECLGYRCMKKPFLAEQIIDRLRAPKASAAGA